MKTTKLFGAVALTAALAMGTMPAFAVQTSSTVPSDWLNGTDNGVGGAGVSQDTKTMNVVNDAGNKVGTGSTAVKATVFDADLNVTVPLQVSVTFASDGGELTCPSASAYKIYNHAENKEVTIMKIEGKAGTGWSLVEAGNASLNGAASNSKMINLQASLNGGTPIDLATKAASGGSLSSAERVKVPGGDGIDPGACSIQLSGKTNKFATPLNAGYVESTVATITYTIAAGDKIAS